MKRRKASEEAKHEAETGIGWEGREKDEAQKAEAEATKEKGEMCEGAMCQDEVVDVKDDAWGGWSPEGDPAWFDQPATLVPKDAGLPEKAGRRAAGQLRAQAKAKTTAASEKKRASIQRIEA